ncbi:hypothetical protein BP5796_00268 [Coleophoma crateriformis]|uniref:Uncharacterized protein n=1 Tax=Coleophoma crateriformis TaxID=565419 RepID=A0A3D8T7K1_9HELO|nr:hypothetical protein BP5796_00268 [Coleophoma crateriformis]
MPLFRSSAAISRIARRSVTAGTRQPIAARFISTSPGRYATQGYGDGKGDPRAENPQDQGSSNNTKHNLEHPGPEPVSAGQGSGAGPTKGGSSSKSPEDASAQSGGARSKEAEETGSSPTGGSVGGSGGKNHESSEGSPLHKNNDPKPSAGSAAKEAEVKEHNEDFEQRHDRAAPAAEDKVDKKFWSGTFAVGAGDR